jgi:hypothetical protein
MTGAFLSQLLTFFSFSDPFEFFLRENSEIGRSAHGPTDEPGES